MTLAGNPPFQSFGYEVAAGSVNGYSSERKFGSAPDIGSTEIVISTASMTIPFMPAAPVTVEILSNSSLDTATGASLRTINIVGLDANWNEIVQSVTMMGTTAVQAATQMTRVYRAAGLTCGTYGGSNVGALTIRSTASQTFVLVASGQGQTMSSHYCVPEGYIAYISDVHISVPSRAPVDLKFWQRQNASNSITPSPVRIVQIFDGCQGDVDYNYSDSLLRFQPKTDLWFTGTATSGANGSASIEYLIIKRDTSTQ